MDEDTHTRIITADLEANEYNNKAEKLRLEITMCRDEEAEIARHIEGWTRKQEVVSKRRARVSRQLEATRIAQRAAEDAADSAV